MTRKQFLELTRRDRSTWSKEEFAAYAAAVASASKSKPSVSLESRRAAKARRARIFRNGF